MIYLFHKRYDWWGVHKLIIIINQLIN